MIVVDLQRCAELVALSQSRIEAQSDLVELGLTADRQVGALGQVLTQQAVGVFVATALPWTVRVGEIHLHAGARSQCGVLAHLLALVVRKRFAQGFGYALQGLAETLLCIGGAGAAHLGQHDKSTGAFDQRAHRGTVTRAFDEVTFPMSGNQAFLSTLSSKLSSLYVLIATAYVSFGKVLHVEFESAEL